jgi:hypothetical protein
MTPSREALHAVVERSPACVAVHDREGWLGLFGDEAFIEDPVGSAAAAKADGTLGRFYDTFIAPHQIRFAIRRDHYLGTDVFRDAVIHTRVRPGVEVEVPAYLLYQLDPSTGELRVRRMAAHWALLQMTQVALALGPRAWWAMTGLFARMVGTMGLPWVGAYLASLWRGIGGRGHQAAAALCGALKARDAAAIGDLFAEGPDAKIELGTQTLTPAQLIAALPPAVQLQIEAPVAAGWTLSFRFRLPGGSPGEGLGLLEFDPASRRIHRARFFPA